MADSNFNFESKYRQYKYVAGYLDMNTFEKTITEITPLSVEFKHALPENEILNSVTSTVTAKDSAGVDKSSTLISGIEVIDETQLKCKILAAGTLNADYIITFKGITLPNAYVVEENVLLQLRADSLT
jgi:hypothetical protein